MTPRLRSLLALVATAVVGGVTFTVYAPARGLTAADYADAGVSGPNRVATCPVRVSPECAQAYGTRRYETVRFLVVLGALADGGRDVLLPPRPRGVASECLRVMDWTECDIDPTASFPAVAAKWDAPVPVTLARQVSRYVIPDCRRPDGGYDLHLGDDGGAVPDCRRRELDGGSRWFGCNVMRRAEAVGTQCIAAPTGVIVYGERLEESL